MTTLHIEGGLLPADLLDALASGEAPGQAQADFGLPRSARLNDEIAAAWADARAYWEAFRRSLRRLPDDDPATTPTRELWMLPLLRSLGFDDIAFMPRAAVVDGSTYAISHAAVPGGGQEAGEGTPVHIAGCRTDLDRRPPTGRPRLSPHALVQEYLNRTEHLWGVVTNGYRVRLLRNSSLMTRPAYVEFDLQQMLEGEHFADFAVFYRLLHRSRLPRGVQDAAECWLERYYQQALEQGGRVRERLRDGVEEALVILGSAFLREPGSAELRARFALGAPNALTAPGALTAPAYYRQLLRLIYRLLFLMVSEERNLVGPDDAALAALYRQYYSVTRLRDLVEGYVSRDDRHTDLWQSLLVTFRLYAESEIAHRFGMEALDGDLFGPDALPDLEGAALSNYDLLRALRYLSLYREDHAVRRVNYGALDVEELGSVYEGLLEYHPVVERSGGARDQGALTFTLVRGSERKTTGSYYTRPELVQELIKSALAPVVEERLAAAKRANVQTFERENVAPVPTPEEQAILSIRVCDVACGSGAFLLAAARYLGRELARVRSGEAHPTPTEFRRAVRDVIRSCIYGVDLNPLAVDLCKVALWLEGHNRGRPLTFLDHRIKHGDSLVGVLDLAVLVEGIPEGAYQPVSGDDKVVARGLRDQNKQEQAGQLGLFETAEPPDLAQLARLWEQINATPDEDVGAVRRKQALYREARDRGSIWWQLWTACNLWTAPFFATYAPETRTAIPTTGDVRGYLGHPGAGHGQKVGLANTLGAAHPFFHWPLEFPDVLANGGFDVLLSNPPWERIKLQEQDFFPARDPLIAVAPNKEARVGLIKALPKANPELWEAFQDAKREAESASRFLRGSGRYPLTAKGDINTYQVFAELLTNLVASRGRLGVILPTGIVTDYYTQDFFGELVEAQRLQSVVGFENEAFIFPDVHNETKFCALTVGGTSALCEEPDYVFFCRYFYQVQESLRHFTLSREDVIRINPNTGTCPVFRTRPDAELTRKVYKNVPILVDEQNARSSWGMNYRQGLFHSSNDASLYNHNTRSYLVAQGYHLSGTLANLNDEVLLPMYDGRMIWQFDHRFASFFNKVDPGERPSRKYKGWYGVDPLDPSELPIPRYWVAKHEVDNRAENLWDHGWLVAFRDVTSNVVTRTVIFSVVPRYGISDQLGLVSLEKAPSVGMVAAFVANMNAIVFDFIARQKIGSSHLKKYTLQQLPVLPPHFYPKQDVLEIIPRVLELTYTAWDLAPFGDDLWREAPADLRTALTRQWEANAAATGGGHAGAVPPDWVALAPDGFPHPPFKWDEDRRAMLRAELDALYARLYGLTEEELRYILDPADVYGEDFPGETFRVLKQKEIKAYGEYRTRRLVLEAWDRL